MKKLKKEGREVGYGESWKVGPERKDSVIGCGWKMSIDDFSQSKHTFSIILFFLLDFDFLVVAYSLFFFLFLIP